MSGTNKKRAGKERIESLGIPKHRFVQWWQRSDKANTTLRVTIAVVAAMALLAACQTWRTPFAYRDGDILTRDVVTRVRFQVEDVSMTQALREQRGREVLTLYRNRNQPLEQLRAELKDQLFLITTADQFAMMNADERAAFDEFVQTRELETDSSTNTNRDTNGETGSGIDIDRDSAAEELFDKLNTVLSTDPELEKIDSAVLAAMTQGIGNGVIVALQHTAEQGSQRMIRVYSGGRPEESVPVEVSKVRIAQVSDTFRKFLADNIRRKFDEQPDALQDVVVDLISGWVIGRLPNYETLQYDDPASQAARTKETRDVQPVMTTFYTGKSVLADAGTPLDSVTLALLRKEWKTFNQKMHLSDQLIRVLAYAGMIAAFYLLCGAHVFFVGNRRLIEEPWQLFRLLAATLTTVGLAFFAARGHWHGELIPLVLMALIASVVYGRELALLLLVCCCLSVTLLLGTGLDELVILLAATSSSVLLLGRIRSRTHLLNVGGIAAAITVATVIWVGVVSQQSLAASEIGTELEPLYRGPIFDTLIAQLGKHAFYAGCWVMVSATAMTGLLPLVERAFGVQTDLSLLELGDASHPLLRRLAQRAPGTYNHSINVASIAEAAADSIGANGLLVRVGAYFHDIGKMFKPEYFIENQSGGVNQHDSLQPAMSTLVIIAHVKDGADLARNHHLPEPLIDFVLQHHGTTLVEYFYREAAKRSEEDPNGEAVSDKDFRYPGPKPQTREAAVLMLADAVESASRTLVDPTPARIQGLVDSIAQKKVADGQFDECGLTFRQHHRIRLSLVKSLTAIYHARVKYPGSQSA